MGTLDSLERAGTDEARLAVAVELAFDARLELDSTERILAWNSGAAKLFGWPREEAIGQHMGFIVSPRHQNAFFSSLARAAASGAPPPAQPLPMRALHCSGHRFSTELFVYTCGTGKHARILIFVRDLTNWEQLQSLLAERADQRAILNFIEDGYTELDLQGNHQWVNDAWCHTFDRKREEVLDPSYQKITHNAVSVDIRGLFKSVYRTGEPLRSFEYEYVPGRFCEITVSLKRGDQGQPTGFVTLTRDTTERKRHERELASARDAADAANRAKGEFLANISHEIRTPMNGIIGMTELALSTYLSEEQREYLGMVRSSAEDLLVIINDILDYSKIEAGKVALLPVRFNLRELVGDTLKSLAIAAQRKNLELACHFHENTPPWVVGDPVRLRQVLVNLASNAVKFTATGEVMIHAELESQDEAGSKVHFAVRDTGIGVPLEKQQRLFRPFEQADSSTTRQYGGTGLGLAISKRIVELMGGEIWMESAPGAGSTFHFTAGFGVARAPEEPSMVSTAKLGPSLPAALHPLSILVAEDNTVNQKLVVSMLRKMGHLPTVAVDGVDAVAKSRDTAFDLILMDVNMPGIDGLEATRRIRSAEHAGADRTPIIAMTACAMSGDRERCIEAGMDDYLSKPVTIESVARTLARYPACVPRPAG